MPAIVTNAPEELLPETRKELYLLGVKYGQVKPEDQLPPEQVDEFFGVTTPLPPELL